MKSCNPGKLVNWDYINKVMFHCMCWHLVPYHEFWTYQFQACRPVQIMWSVHLQCLTLILFCCCNTGNWNKMRNKYWQTILMSFVQELTYSKKLNLWGRSQIFMVVCCRDVEIWLFPVSWRKLQIWVGTRTYTCRSKIPTQA